MPLGRGLASLIPNRRTKNSDQVEEDIDQIDSMEVVEQPVAEEQEPTVGVPVIEEDETSEPVAPTPIAPEESTEAAPTNSFEDFQQLEGGEEMPLPEKPLVTPLELDPEKDADLIDLVREADLPVQAEETAAETVAAETVEEAPVAVKPEKKEKKAVAARKPRTELTQPSENKWDRHEENISHIAIGDITINPLQPRRNFDATELAELKSSIDQHGILQPLVVRRTEDGTYELIAGERRLRAAKELQWSKVPVVIRRGVSGDQTRLVYALIENIQRENLNPIELALGYQRLHDEYGLSHEEIGERIGKSRVSVTNAMRVLQLPAEIQRGLTENKITAGHARAILMIPDEEKQIRFYQHLVDEGLTVRKAETRARRIQRTLKVHDPMRQKLRKRHPLARQYGPPLEERFATDVDVKFNDDKSRFEVILKAYNAVEFEQLIGRLLGTLPLPSEKRDSDILEA